MGNNKRKLKKLILFHFENFPLCALLLSWCGHSWHSCHIPISEFNILLNGRSCKIETTAGENWTKNPALLTLEKTLVLKFQDLISKTGYLRPQSLNTAVMPCDLGRSWANIYGSSVGWLESTRMSKQPIYLLFILEGIKIA